LRVPVRTADRTAGVLPEFHGTPFHFQRVEQQQAPRETFADAGRQFQGLGRLHGADNAGQRRENPHHRTADFLDIVAFGKQAVVAR